MKGLHLVGFLRQSAVQSMGMVAKKEKRKKLPSETFRTN
jgi:hypothetical protein